MALYKEATKMSRENLLNNLRRFEMIQQVHHKVKKLFFMGLVIFSSILLFSGTIAAQPITVTSPNGGESWMLGKTVNIRWTRGMIGPENVRIILRKGGQDIIIISSKTANDKSYSWSIPNNLVPDSNYRIRIEGVGGTISDQSDGAFTIRLLLKKWEPSPVKVIPLPPVIESVSAPRGVQKDVLQAGAGVDLYGKNFGTQPGKIWMSGNFIESPDTVEFVDVWWDSDKHVKGTVHTFPKGQPDQTVEIWVETIDGLKSNSWYMDFKEVRTEEKFLTQDDVVVFLCSHDCEIDVCNNVVYKDWSEYFAPGCPDDLPICGYHENKAGNIDPEDDGIDNFEEYSEFKESEFYSPYIRSYEQYLKAKNK